MINKLEDYKQKIDELYELTKIDRFFLDKLKKIIDLEKKVKIYL